jgi:glucose-6-phosphate 1-dehydrogenase
VRNVYYLRYANPILERLFKNTLIHHVEVTASETLGIEGRAGYFEHTGAFRDMFQSHLLEICALLTMQVKDTDDLIAESRMNALKQIYLPPASSLDDIVLQGQYVAGMSGDKPARGYREEEGVAPDSRTNTYAALKLQSKDARWQGVPFYLRSGKRLAKKETRISIRFLEPRTVGKGSEPNRLDIILQGEAGMRLHLQTKLGGTEPSFRPLILEDPLVCIGDCLPEHGLLILEAINGKRQWFLSPDEIRAAWRLTDPIQAHFEHDATPLHLYPAGSHGPKEAEEWMTKEGLAWL